MASLTKNIVGAGLICVCIILTQTVFAASPAKGSLLSMDDQLMNVAEKAPAFGGMFYDANSDQNVYLTNPKAKTAVEAALKNVFGCNIENSHPSMYSGEVLALNSKNLNNLI